MSVRFGSSVCDVCLRCIRLKKTRLAANGYSRLDVRAATVFARKKLTLVSSQVHALPPRGKMVPCAILCLTVGRQVNQEKKYCKNSPNRSSKPLGFDYT